MCGIVGFFGRGDRSLLAAMNGTIRHRGPDDEGAFVAPGVGLAMRRLSIIDLAGGQQPIANESGRMQIVFNGELYNYRELKAAHLGGHRFTTASDTEVVLHLYEEYGPRAFAMLNGMYAFALWDGDARTLYLVRDRLGVKPLYWAQAPDRLVFASEIKALLADPTLERALDPASLHAFLTWQYVPGPATMLEGLHKLPPGHFLALREEETPRLEAYWQPVPAPGAPSDPAEFKARLRAAVERQMVADVPVGAFLSGGVDSGLVVAAMREFAGPGLATFTAGFDDPRLDESPLAAAVARRLGVNHEVVKLDASALAAMPDLVWYLDEPIADRAALPTYWLAKAAREQVKVVLTGEGADELFGGYPRYRLEAWARRFHALPLSERRGLWRALVALAPASLRPRLAKLLLSPADADRRREHWVSALSPEWRRDLLGPGAAAAHPVPALAGPDLASQLKLDMQTWLVDNVLMKADKMTMAASLEARVPFLDHELVDWALALPDAAKLALGVPKRLVKQAAEGVLPEPVIHQFKRGFHTPTALWFREGPGRQWLTDVLLGDRARGRGLIATHAVERLIREHQDGHDRDQALWNLVVLELWLSRYLDVAPAAMTGTGP